MNNQRNDGPEVAVIIGSDSDWSIMEGAKKILDDFKVDSEVKVLSAHRSPDLTREFALSAKTKGIKVIIAGAGGAAHLAGVIASHTTLPVIGVPMPTKNFKGMDSLLSTIQMPWGIPVATMAVGSSGAKNAALFAIQILALQDEDLKTRFSQHKKSLIEAVREKQANLNSHLTKKMKS